MRFGLGSCSRGHRRSPHMAPSIARFLLLLVGIGLVTNVVVAKDTANDKPQMPRPFSELDFTRLRELNENCLECICDDIRGMGCDVRDLCGTGMVSGACDLLNIEEEYWETAGRPMAEARKNDQTYAALNCRRDPKCSGLAVLNFMAVFDRDCPTRVARTCLDYAAVHFYGYEQTACETSPATQLGAQRRGRIEMCLADKKKSSQQGTAAATAAAAKTPKRQPASMNTNRIAQNSKSNPLQ